MQVDSMDIFTKLLISLGTTVIQIISFFGYFGVFVLMAMESMILPVPSEMVMPFAGFLIANGNLNFWLVVLVSGLGSICGSLVSYSVGRYGGNPIVMKYGKYFLLDVKDLLNTEQWFKKRGEKTILISRFIPIVRHLISIPAGIGKMNLKKFIIYTAVGATIWNAFLAYMGFLLGKNWELVKHYSEYVSIPVLIILATLVILFIYKHLRHTTSHT